MFEVTADFDGMLARWGSRPAHTATWPSADSVFQTASGMWAGRVSHPTVVLPLFAAPACRHAAACASAERVFQTEIGISDGLEHSVVGDGAWALEIADPTTRQSTTMT